MFLNVIMFMCSINLKEKEKMKLENYTKKELINLINQQQRRNECERTILYKKIKELEDQIRELSK